MIDKVLLREALALYKDNVISTKLEAEKYKWEAVQVFQDNWDLEAPNFAKMLSDSLSKTSNLLASKQVYPRKMINYFAEHAPEDVRRMFADLFNEQREITARFADFKNSANTLFNRYEKEEWNRHYQNENAISVYLWLRYPDQYYIYKHGIAISVASALKSDYHFKKGAYANNLRSFYRLYDEICDEINKDEELVDLVNSYLDEHHYPDPACKTLTVDFCFYTWSSKKRETASSISPPLDIQQELSKNDEYMAIEDRAIMSDMGNEPYDKNDFLKEVYMGESRYGELVAVLENKKNIILQGAPGVGKTFVARRLAYSMMGEKDNSRIEFIQFHQNYSYEDFMMGYRPVEGGFELQDGVFYRFCQKAANQPEKDFFFIIDEINRGNMSKIFGEILMLIERDYRDDVATLAYNGLPFSVPKNIYLIGTMNTADRSLAMIDYALRRRFSFFDMEPAFQSEGFKKYQKGLENDVLDELIVKIESLNEEIARDPSLGKGFRIGHSYFCEQEDCSEQWLRTIVEYEILPLLSEYWFDNNKKLQRWENELRGIF